MQEIVALAKAIASDAHQGQFRRGGVVPYIEHPRAVAARVGDDLDTQVVAWLHDVIEDCDVSEEYLHERGIPEKHVSAVIRLTKVNGVEYIRYLDRVAECPLATKVKIADMISNLADNPSPRQIRKCAVGLERLTRDGSR